jgi:tRNA nucleotidyltransferase (CCA-adding enzyme)
VIHRAAELKSDTILKLLEATDAFRRPERFADLLQVCESDARGRTGLEDRPYPQAAYLSRALQAAASVALPEEDRAGLQGQEIRLKLRSKRLAAVAQVKAAADLSA